jgi:hypothetical protein
VRDAEQLIWNFANSIMASAGTEMREARSEVKTVDATKPVKHYDAGEPIMKFLALLIAAIFLSAPALAETATNSPVSSQFAAAAKAAKVSSKVKKLGPRVCPHPEDDECRAWCCTCGAKCLGTSCNPLHCP